MNVNANLSSLHTQRMLFENTKAASTAMERLATGSKINKAQDDVAGSAIADRMTSQVRGLNMAVKNVNDAMAMLSVADSAASDITDMLQRMRELAIQAANDTNSAADRQYLQDEVDSLIQEIDRVATQTKYNGETLLDGSDANRSYRRINLQIGGSSGHQAKVTFYSVSSHVLGSDLHQIGNITHLSDQGNVFWTDDIGFQDGDWVETGDTVTYTSNTNIQHEVVYANPGIIDIPSNDLAMGQDVSTGDAILEVDVPSNLNGSSLVGDNSSALDTLSRAIEQVTAQRAEYGAMQNRLQYTISNLMGVSENTVAARSRIEDADFATESAVLAKSQVLQQTGAAMLAQANARPQLVLQLIK